MEEVPVRRLVWGGFAVAGMIVVWIAGLGALILAYIGRGLFREGADPRLGWIGLGIAAVLAGGPLVVAGGARLLRLPGVPRVFFVIAAVFVLPAVYVAWLSWNEFHPRTPAPTEPWTPPTHCVAYSGGSNNCPGG